MDPVDDPHIIASLTGIPSTPLVRGGLQITVKGHLWSVHTSICLWYNWAPRGGGMPQWGS